MTKLKNTLNFLFIRKAFEKRERRKIMIDKIQGKREREKSVPSL